MRSELTLGIGDWELEWRVDAVRKRRVITPLPEDQGSRKVVKVLDEDDDEDGRVNADVTM
uniref:GH26828p n=1 Tax=Drosophila melanogaster TaxID=7227 RepID=Q9W595_DROME|nr:GH26828p [Drosophila melanogaster]